MHDAIRIFRRLEHKRPWILHAHYSIGEGFLQAFRVRGCIESFVACLVRKIGLQTRASCTYAPADSAVGGDVARFVPEGIPLHTYEVCQVHSCLCLETVSLQCCLSVDVVVFHEEAVHKGSPAERYVADIIRPAVIQLGPFLGKMNLQGKGCPDHPCRFSPWGRSRYRCAFRASCACRYLVPDGQHGCESRCPYTRGPGRPWRFARFRKRRCLFYCTDEAHKP
jgi:hypothetical protein